MIFELLELGPLMTNCYIVGDENSKKAAVVDPGGGVEQITMVLERFGLECDIIINTHCHPDHVGANAALASATGAPIAVHEHEVGILANIESIGSLMGFQIEKSPEAGRILKEGDIIEVGDIKMKVLHVPGHSSGSICLLMEDENKIIVGDVLFQMSIGRTDFPGGDFEQLIKGIKEKLLPLDGDMDVYPGHGQPTKMGYEKKYNPFLNDGVIV